MKNFKRYLSLFVAAFVLLVFVEFSTVEVSAKTATEGVAVEQTFDEVAGATDVVYNSGTGTAVRENKEEEVNKGVVIAKAGGIALVITAVIALIMRLSLKRVNEASTAHQYVTQMTFTRRSDVYTHTTTTKTKIQSNNK